MLLAHLVALITMITKSFGSLLGFIAHNLTQSRMCLCLHAQDVSFNMHTTSICIRNACDADIAHLSEEARPSRMQCNRLRHAERGIDASTPAICSLKSIQNHAGH